jgi:hypothetical protein
MGTLKDILTILDREYHQFRENLSTKLISVYTEFFNTFAMYQILPVFESIEYLDLCSNRSDNLACNPDPL